MSDNYGDVRGEATTLVDRFAELETRHQAMLAFETAAEDGSLDDAHAWTNERRARELQVYSDQWYGEIRSWFEDIEELFDELADLPDPGTLLSTAQSLNPALSIMSGPSGHTDISGGTEYAPSASFDKLQSVPTYLADWNGIAADAFKSNFIPPLERVAHNEFEAIVSLRSPLLAAGEMWKQARKDVSDLIDETNSALDDYEGGKGAADAVLALSIIGAVVAVAAVPFTGGTSAALYWAIAGSAIGVTGAVVGYPAEPKKELDISGDTPADIAVSLRQAVADMKLQWIENEIFIRDKIRSLTDLISGYTAPSEDSPPLPRYPNVGAPTSGHTYSQATVHEFSLPRPALADTTPGNAQDDDHFGKPD
ncbi:hypothetical protein [Nocardioides sp. 1609]|uniref:hypothetical protein n=1 Tax=Nocardioides sp. 1609 TaxID=2508327 RepID=UPI00106F2758|nr:hypothetical protein [Nocardioides sp. 1609]